MTNLSFTIDADDSAASLVRSSDENCVTADTIHIDTSGSFDVVQMDVTVFGNEIYHIVFRAHLRHTKFAHLTTTRQATKFPRNTSISRYCEGKTYLHSYWKVILRFYWEEYIHRFFLKWLVSRRRLPNFDNVQLLKPNRTQLTPRFHKKISPHLNTLSIILGI